ncbi:Unknown protein sequence [Pseudomonas syringae pv. maculicola]|nr:Unknown protein sequence [Pseudomonas syringae pv. maculicola]
MWAREKILPQVLTMFIIAGNVHPSRRETAPQQAQRIEPLFNNLMDAELADA